MDPGSNSDSSNAGGGSNNLSLGGSGESATNQLAKTILEWVFFSGVVSLCLSLLLWRLLYIRKRHKPLRQFFTFSPPIDRSTLPTHRSLSPTRPSLANHPTASFFQHLGYPARTRGADIGRGGRRLDTGVESCGYGDKDELPPYDDVNGPPEYHAVDMVQHRPLSAAGDRQMQAVHDGQTEDENFNPFSSDSGHTAESTPAQECDITEQHTNAANTIHHES